MFANTSRLPSDQHADRNPLQSFRENDNTQIQQPLKFLATVGSLAVAVAVDFDFNPLLTLPIVRGRNGIKRVRCLSRRRVSDSPHF